MYQLRTFSDVARTGSITRSARNLGYSQSSVTAHVRALELRVGATLFQRLPHGVRLTRAGEMFRGYVDQILAVVDKMSTALQRKGEAAGRVAVGATAPLVDTLVPRLVADVQGRHPRVRVSPRVLAATDLVAQVGDGVDLAFTLDDRTVGTVPRDRGVSTAELFAVELVAVAAPGGHEDRLVAADSGCVSHRALVRAAKDGRVGDRAVVETGSVAGARDLVLAGAGVAMLPLAAVTRHLASGALVEAAGIGRVTPVVTAVWPDQDWTSPAVAATLEIVRRQGARILRPEGSR